MSSPAARPPQPQPQKAWTPPDPDKDYRESMLRLGREQNRLLLQMKTRLSWIALFTGLPYILALLALLFWLIMFALFAAGLAGAGAMMSEELRREAVAPPIPAPGPVAPGATPTP